MVIDVFESNEDLKAMMVFDSEDYTDTELINNINNCNVLECSALAMGTIFDCRFTNVFVEADYCVGSIVRVFIHIENYESQEIIPESKKEKEDRLEILKDIGRDCLDYDNYKINCQWRCGRVY